MPVILLSYFVHTFVLLHIAPFHTTKTLCISLAWSGIFYDLSLPEIQLDTEYWKVDIVPGSCLCNLNSYLLKWIMVIYF